MFLKKKKNNKTSSQNSYDKICVKNFIKKYLGSYYFLSQFWYERLWMMKKKQKNDKHIWKWQAVNHNI